MSAAADPPLPPRPKDPPPGLLARAPRPSVVRLRNSVVRLAGLSAAALLAGALAWAFVIQPQMRARAHRTPAEAGDPRGPVRPADLVAQQPGTYDHLSADQLPPPRIGGPSRAPTTAQAQPQRTAPAPAASEARNAARQAAQSGIFFASPAAAAASPSSAAAPAGAGRPDDGAVYNGHRLLSPRSPYELKAGAIVPAVLLTAIDTARPGPVVASVTENVFDSVSGRILLLPQGSRLIGRHNGDTAYGDRRAFVTWDRLILPNGKSLVLTEEPGVDAQGALGVRGAADRRLGALAAATLAGAAITTLGTVARDEDHRSSGGILGDVGDAAAIQGAQVGGRLVERELQVHPSIRLSAGAPVRVLITRDLILEPFRP